MKRTFGSLCASLLLTLALPLPSAQAQPAPAAPPSGSGPGGSSGPANSAPPATPAPAPAPAVAGEPTAPAAPGPSDLAPSEHLDPAEAPETAAASSSTTSTDLPSTPATLPVGETDPTITAIDPSSAAPVPQSAKVPPEPPAPSSPTASPLPDAAPTDATSGPVIELAEEHDPQAPLSAEDLSLSARRASASVFSGLPGDNQTTTIGGYAQFQLTSVRRGFDNPFDTSATIRRLVLLFTHQITDKVTAYTEVEWENAIACATCAGAVEIEQAYIDWQLSGDALTLRSGLVLIPMGLINLWHEPPIFHGVDRPQLEQVLIPTTWRELGAGFTGLLSDKLEYQIYLTTTLVPSRLGPNGFLAARQLGSNALSKAGAVSARVDYEPVLGLSFSGSVFASDAGANGDYYNADGERVDFTFPILGGSFTGRFNRRGWEARTVGAAFWMPEAGALMNARRADGGLLFPNVDRTGAVATRMVGGLVEVAYDVLRFFDSSHQLLPFVRAEMYDTQSAVPSAYLPNRAFSVEEWTMGLTYRPIRQLVFKSDVQLRDRRSGLDELQFNVGMGYML